MHIVKCDKDWVIQFCFVRGKCHLQKVEGCIVHRNVPVCMHTAKDTGKSTHRRDYYYQGKDQKSCFLQPERGSMLNVTHAHSLAQECIHRGSSSNGSSRMQTIQRMHLINMCMNALPRSYPDSLCIKHMF